MTRLRIASYRRNRELRKELVATLDAATRVAVENQCLRDQVARKDREIAELESELRAYQGVA
jgi:hypothetical protein